MRTSWLRGAPHGAPGLRRSGYHGIDAQFGSTAPAVDTRTVSAIQNKNTGSGTSTWLETLAQESSGLRFRFSLLCRSSRDFSCKSSSALSARFSLDCPHSEGENRKRHLCTCRYQLLIMERLAMNLPIVEQNTNCRSSFWTFVLLDAVWIPCLPAAFRLRDQQQQSSDVGASQTLGSGRSGKEPTCTKPAHSGRFVGAQHDRARHPPRGPRGALRSQQHSARPMAWTGSSGTPTFANAAGSTAFRNGAAAVMGTKHNGASASQNNRSSASYQFSATISVCHITSPPYGMAAPRGQRTDGWASPPHFHTHAEQCAYRSATRFRAEVH